MLTRSWHLSVRASTLRQVSKPQAVLTPEPGTAGSKNLFRSPAEIMGKFSDTGMPRGKEISPYSVLLSALHQQHNIKPPQNEGSLSQKAWT